MTVDSYIQTIIEAITAIYSRSEKTISGIAESHHHITVLHIFRKSDEVSCDVGGSIIGSGVGKLIVELVEIIFVFEEVFFLDEIFCFLIFFIVDVIGYIF